MEVPRDATPTPPPLLLDNADEPRADCHDLLDTFPEWAMIYVRELLRALTRLLPVGPLLSVLLG